MIAIIETKPYGRTLTIKSAFSTLVMEARDYKRFSLLRSLIDAAKDLPKVIPFAAKAVFVWRDFEISEVVYDGESMTMPQFFERRKAERKKLAAARG